MTISDAIDATVAALDAIHAPARERRARDLESLAGIVARLDVVSMPIDESEATISDRPREREASMPGRREEESAFGPPEPDWRRLERRRLERTAIDGSGW